LLLTSEARAEAEVPKDPLTSWWERINETLDKVAEPYKIVPPTPVKVRWHPREIWSGELSGEVVDMLAVDLRGVGKGELVALTDKELVVFSRLRGLFDIRMRAALPKKPALLRSRDAIGSLSAVVARDAPLTLRARTSEQAMGGLYQFADGALGLVSEFAGYPLCEQGTIQAAPGRNYFDGKRASWASSEQKKKLLGESLYSVRCTSSPDPTGRSAEYMSEVSIAGELRVHCSGEAAHCQSFEREHAGVGDAHLVADVDNDGYPEIIHSGRGAAGAGDNLFVLSHDQTITNPSFEMAFQGGIVAIAAGDFVGDGALEVVAAVRKGGSKRVSLWLLN
jgi:hypothetical protein